MRNNHLENFWEDQHSHDHIQGALALLSHFTGSVVALYGPFLWSSELVEKILEEIPFSSKDNYEWI
jgi:hypothetical protein